MSGNLDIHLDGGVDGGAKGVALAGAVVLVPGTRQLAAAPQHGAHVPLVDGLVAVLLLPRPHLRLTVHKEAERQLGPDASVEYDACGLATLFEREDDDGCNRCLISDDSRSIASIDYAPDI